VATADSREGLDGLTYLVVAVNLKQSALVPDEEGPTDLAAVTQVGADARAGEPVPV
jgi:hypothetical protein